MVADWGLKLPREYEQSFKELGRASRELEQQMRLFGASSREIERQMRLFGASTAFGKAVKAAAEMGVGSNTQVLRFAEEDQRRLAKMAELFGPSKDGLAEIGSLSTAATHLRGLTSELEGFSKAFAPIDSALKSRIADLGVRMPVALSMTRALEAAFVTKLELARIPADLVTGIDGWKDIRRGLDEMLIAQKTLFESFNSPAGLSIPSIVIDWPPLGVLSHAALLNRLVAPVVPAGEEAEEAEEPSAERLVERIAETEDDLLGVLEDRPDLRDEWVAAREVLRGANLRRARYFCLSVRQLLSRVLDVVAPLEVVAAWAEVNNAKERTTARSRFRYVASIYPRDQFAAYVVKDSEEMFKAWDLVGTRVHESVPTEEELKALEWRAAVWILGVLTLSRDRMS